VPTKKLKLIREIEDLFAMFAKEKYPLLNSKRPSLKGLWKPR
jgi:hypothetical protein